MGWVQGVAPGARAGLRAAWQADLAGGPACPPTALIYPQYFGVKPDFPLPPSYWGVDGVFIPTSWGAMAGGWQVAWGGPAMSWGGGLWVWSLLTYLLWFIPPSPQCRLGCCEPLAVSHSAVVCLILPGLEDSSWVTGGRSLSIVPCWCGPELRVLPTLSPPRPHPPKLHLKKQGSPYITSYTWREGIRGVWRCLETPGSAMGRSVTQFPHCLGQVGCS